MRLFVLRDDTLPRERLLGYLIYYETAKAFYMELSDGIDPWEAPPLFSAFAERGAYSINSYWSLRWVQQPKLMATPMVAVCLTEYSILTPITELFPPSP